MNKTLACEVVSGPHYGKGHNLCNACYSAAFDQNGSPVPLESCLEVTGVQISQLKSSDMMSNMVHQAEKMRSIIMNSKLRKDIKQPVAL